MHDRPSIVYKADEANGGEDVIVIPLTSAAREKLTDKFDKPIAKDTHNNLYQNSFARLRQSRSVSLKRLGKEIGVITDDSVKELIDTGMKEMLGI